MTGPRATRALFRCDGAAVPPELARQAWDVSEEIRARGSKPDLTMKVENLARRTSGELDPRVRDLFRIATYAFAADRAAGRGGPVDVHREGWSRALTLCVPVADPAFWSSPEVLGPLTEALGFGTGDAWTFVFDRAQPEAGQIPIRWAPAPDGDATALFAARPDVVVLFSGGTDSLCALVELLAGGARRPLVVSHWPAAQVDARQLRLLRDVRRLFGRWELPHVGVEIHRAGTGDGERSQRSRGFLYACLGAVVAAHVGAGEVVLADNGYVSINPPINDQLVGTLASRGTHPKFLLLVNRFLNRVFGGAVRVANPLWSRTRAEALGVLAASGCPELLAATHSCGKLQAPIPGKPHCGGCSQCVDRRTAVVRAGLEAHDPVEGYGLDLFRSALPESEARTVALSYFRFADRLRRIDPDWVFNDIPELQACLDPDDPAYREQELAIPELLGRHGEEAVTALATMIRRHASELSRRELPPEALIPLWLGESGATASGPAQSFGVAPAPQRSRFVRDGKRWHLVFRGDKDVVAHAVGMTRLGRLLKAPGQPVPALDLVAGSTAPTEDGWKRGALDPRAAVEDLRSDAPARAGAWRRPKDADLKRRAEELEQELAALPPDLRDDAPRREEIRRELEAIADKLVAEAGWSGVPARPGDAHERARTAVRHSIDVARQAIHAVIPPLHEHLAESLRFGNTCTYDPRPPEDWDVKL